MTTQVIDQYSEIFKGLSPKEYDVARHLAYGLSTSQVALEMEMPLYEVLALERSTEFRIKVAAIQGDFAADASVIKLRIESAANLALDQLINLMLHSKWDSVKFQASKDILDRAGHGAVQKTENISYVSMDQRAVHLIVQTGKEMDGRK